MQNMLKWIFKVRSSIGMRAPCCLDHQNVFVSIQGTSVFGLNNKVSLIVPVDLIQASTNVPTTALINSGAQGNFIDTTLAQRFEMAILDDAIECRNVDGSPNADSNITQYTWLKVMIGPQLFYIKFNIANLRQEQIILGNTWLQENDPCIIWSTQQLIIPRK